MCLTPKQRKKKLLSKPAPTKFLSQVQWVPQKRVEWKERGSLSKLPETKQARNHGVVNVHPLDTKKSKSPDKNKTR